MTNAEVIELFTNYLTSERRYSPLTVRNYRRDVEAFTRWGEQTSEEFSLLKVRGEDVRAWILSLADKPGRLERRLSAASVNREVASVRSMYRFLRRKELFERDIFASITSARTPKRLPAYVPESRMEEVVRRVFADLEQEDYITCRNALLVLVLYACGVRLAEVVGMNVEDISDGYRSLLVRGKGDKERIIPLVERVGEEVKRYIDRFSPSKICKRAENALFLSKRGERISRSDVQRSVARLLEECGVQGKVSPHVLRHTFATHLLGSGADMREIQELMGHTSLRATQIYTHSDITRLQLAYVKAHPREGGDER